MRIVSRAEIEALLPGLDLLPMIGEGFAAYSAGRAVVPPVGELLLPAGEVHIKYGYLRDAEHYVIKIASGFYGNPQLGLPAGDGLLIVFSQATGAPVAALLDGGLLTDLRTALAGAVAARCLAPEHVERIGVLGTGVQARMQVLQLAGVLPTRTLCVWGRTPASIERYCADMAQAGYGVESCATPAEVAARCTLIVTTTPSTTPLLRAEDVLPGTHITAIGSDTTEKQELAADLLTRAQLVVADSRAQCQTRGEIARALAVGALDPAAVVELGEILLGQHPGRTSPDEITIFDSTGVAVQDVQIATAVVGALGASRG